MFRTRPSSRIRHSTNPWTRWVDLHSTQHVLLQRNIGFLSIGSGFFIEDARRPTTNSIRTSALTLGPRRQQAESPEDSGPFWRPADPSPPICPKTSCRFHPTHFRGGPDYQYPAVFWDFERLERLHRQYGGGRRGPAARPIGSFRPKTTTCRMCRRRGNRRPGTMHMK